MSETTVMNRLPIVIFSISAIAFALPGTPVFAQPRALTIRIADIEESVPSETLSSWFDVQTMRMPGTEYRSEIENTTDCPYDLFLCEAFSSRSGRIHTSVKISERLHENDIRNYLASLSVRTRREPEDARFTVSDGKIVPETESVDGLHLKEGAGFIALTEALLADKTSVELPAEIIPAAINSDDADRLGLRELIGEGKTDFRGSPKNRIHNFTRGTEQFQGLLIAPNEEFSFVKYLGDVDAEHGYLPELVIKNNKTEPEFGGGICQVSTTVFRAAINAGLKITERRNHAYPVSYYKPYGMDATIYIPKPDLTFVNNTPGYILMQAAIEGTNLVFRFYGTSDGRTVTIDGPHILESNPDGSMKTIFSEKVMDASGNIVFNDSFPSNYKSPSLFPHPQPELTVKPDDWSKRQWEDYLTSKAAATTKPATAPATAAN